MTTLDRLVVDAKRQTGEEENARRHEEAAEKRSRAEHELARMHNTAARTFSAVLLSQLKPRYEAAQGRGRPVMTVRARGVRVRLVWGELLWADPGHQDYFETRDAHGNAVQFGPAFRDNDQRLALVLDSFRRNRWWRRLLP